MFIYVVLLISTLVGVNAKGEFTILHHPKSLSLKGHDALRGNTIKEVCTAALGFSNSEYSNWKGLYISDPFNLPESLVVVSVEGVSSIDQPKGHHFPLTSDIEDDAIFNTLEHRINVRYPQGKPEIMQINFLKGLEDLSHYDIFKGIKLDKSNKNLHYYLKKNNPEDAELLKDVNLLNSMADKVSKSIESDGVPDLFWLKVSSLHPLVDLYGDNSTQVKEAKQLLNEALLHLNNAFKKAYDGAVLFSVVTSDSSHTRKARSILADGPSRDLNLATNYSADYPVIFNIVLWLCIVLGFSLLAIALVIGNMDPGRDSIIYRMTNPRMKKDN